MLANHPRRIGGGAITSTSQLLRPVSPLWWVPLVIVAALALLTAFPARGAVVSGEVTMPTSDGGYRPSLNNDANAARVRVEGTNLETTVVATSKYTGTFTLPNVPAGPVTLIYQETRGEDSFTMDSRRLALNVTGNISGVQFNLVHHWKYLPSYPPPWRNASYDIWEPYWASAKVGFILFVNRGVSPQESELWRTINGGTGWTMIGHWVHAAGNVYPDVTGRSMFFADANFGVVTARTTADFGVLRTADGGANWSVIDLPNVPNSNGIAAVHNYARIDATHWIACGSENTGTYYGVGTPFAFTIWETADAGASWQIKRTWLENYASCSAVDANTSGKAVLFATPYAFGGGLHRELRSTTGVWSQVAGNNIVTNSGYGTADVPMIGDLVWVRASTESPTGPGLFQSVDAGATFTKISSHLPQYMDFASAYKGLGPAGGPMYSTYDGGISWLYQSAGGGICCHGDYIWAFDTMNAIWREGGVGDPNGVADIFKYVEPRSANFEVLPGVEVPSVDATAGDASVPILSLKLVNQGPMPLRVSGLTLSGTGSGNEMLDVSAVEAWWDRDANGVVDPTDPLLTAGVYAADDGVVTLNLGSTYPVQPQLPYYVLITYDFSGYVATGGHFAISVTPSTVTARSADTGTVLNVAATAPAGTTITSGSTSVEPSTIGLSNISLSASLVAGCKSVTGTVTLTEAAPAAGLVVYLSDNINAASVSSTVTVPSGATSKTFTVKTVPVSTSESGVVSATLGGSTLNKPLTVRPMALYLFTLSPTTVVGGQAATGKVTLECAAGPGSVTVNLESSNATVAAPVAPSITVPKGSKSADFGVTTTAVLAKTSATISATSNGVTKSKLLTVTPAATVSPTTIKFGNQVVGTTSGVLNATLTNKGGAAFSVSSIGITGTYAAWFAQTNNCPSSLNAGASCTIGVTFKPLAVASRSAKVSIATSATATPLSVTVSGAGVLPPP
jgi:hypothetical protein